MKNTITMTVEEWLGPSNKLGIDIWNNKYRHGDETFMEWVYRVSGGNPKVGKMIVEKKFLFGGRILANRGLNEQGKKVTYSNCYVLSPPEDNIESIFDTAGKLARTFSYGGGVGIDISKLSPRGAKINNTAKATSGAVSFMDLYSLVTGLIGQEGRRGALMLSIDCNHPDLEEFIEVKSDLDKITSANISVRVDDNFMDAVYEGKMHTLRYVRETTGEVIEKEVDAKELFMKLAKMNWDYAEPGILYWDEIKQWNLLSEYDNFEFVGTNPCGEEPLPAGGSCLLGSINLAEFVKDGWFDFEGFREAVYVGVIALNEVLDEGLPLHPLQEQRDSVRDWRQIGLGIMGFADLLIKLGITYGSAESLILIDSIGTTMVNCAVQQSSWLARDEGSFPMFQYDKTSSSEFYSVNVNSSTDYIVRECGMRNSQLLTIAPTGTLSTMLGISGGIEPIFANYYDRMTQSLHGEDTSYRVYTPIVMKYMEKNGILDDSLLPEYFVTARDIYYKDRINVQSAWQRYIDASISSTVNVPSDFTVEDTFELYMYGHAKNLKGVTIYREGCKRGAILTTETTNEVEVAIKSEPTELKRGMIIETSDDVIGKKRKLNTGCGSLHCTAFFDPSTGDLQETYLSKGSTGGCNNFMVGLSRMISLSARAGVDIDTIVDQLNSTGACPSYAVRKATKGDTSKGACCPMAIGNVIKDMWLEVQDELGMIEDDVVEESRKPILNPCPTCGAELQFSGGCNSCPECGYSKCS